MTDLLGLLAYLLLPLAGLFVWRLDEIGRLPLDGRLAMAGAAGALLLPTLLASMALADLEWTPVRIIVACAILGVGSLCVVRPQFSRPTLTWPSIPTAFIVVFLSATAYGLLTARETIGDLLLFWGPKGVHFFHAGTIDVEYLRSPHNFLAHSDYPPLLPLLFVWSNSLSGDFSWWSAVLLSGLCLGGIVALVRAFTRDSLSALLFASVLAYAFAQTHVGGGADPVLLFFEATAVCALLFLQDTRSQTFMAAIGIAGAVVTKVEGASFAAAVALAMVLERQPFRKSLAVFLPAFVLLGGWMVFVHSNDLIDTYGGPGRLSFEYLAQAARGMWTAASYDALWIPWIAPLIVVGLGDVRRARLPLTIALLSVGATLYFYLNSSYDPSVFWIPSSAGRVLLTPLLLVLLAAAAAHAPVVGREEGNDESP